MPFDKDGNFYFKTEEIVSTEDENIENEEKKSKIDVFTVLNNILESKTKLDWDLIKRTYSPFIINRCLANKNNFLEIAVILNRYATKITPEQHYNLLHLIIQPKKKRFLGYFKQGSVDKNIEKLATFFNINKHELIGYLTILGEEKVNSLLKNIENIEKDASKKNLKK